MPIESLLSQKRKSVDKEIENYFPKNPTESDLRKICGIPRYAYDLPSAKAALHTPIWELLDRGGKRWRPALFLMVAQAFGKKSQTLLELSIIPEVIHNGTLMADDIEDNSDFRSGKPTIHKIYGEDIAINASSAMYYLPLLALFKNKSKFPKSTVILAYEIYSQEMINLAYGQSFDILWHKGKNANVTEDQYLQMCAFKTGTLARMAAKLGAVFAGASEKNVALAGRFAEAIGVAFQIQDDILNLTAKEDYGKEIGGDISEGKRSLIIIRALSKLDSIKRKRLLEILDSHTKDNFKIGEAISLIRGTDALEYSSKRASKIVSEAWAEFSKVLKPTIAKKQLEQFAKYLIERKV